MLYGQAHAAFALDITVRGGVHDDFNRLVFDWPKTPVYILQRSDEGRVTLNFKGPAAGFVMTPSTQKLSRIADFAVTPTGDGTEVQFRIAPTASIKDFVSGTAVVVDVTGPAVGQSTKPAESLQAQTPKQIEPADTTSQLIQTQAVQAPISIAADIPAVLFERAAQSYALLDRRGKTILGAADLKPLEGIAGWQRSTQDGVVLAVVASPETLKTGLARIIAGPAAPLEAATALTITAQPDYAAGGRVLVNVQTAGSVISFIDPTMGDTLYAVSTPPGQYVTKLRRFAAFELLPTRQGVVVRPLNDKLTVRLTPEGLELSLPGGLKLSPASTMPRPDADRETSAAKADNSGVPAIDTPALGETASTVEMPGVTEPAEPQSQTWFFDVATAQAKNGETFTMARQRLQTAVASAGPDDPSTRAVARFNLVRFYLANAYGQEASGLLKDIAEDTPDAAAQPQFRAFRGMARTLSEDYDGAVEDLGLPELGSYPDLALWRAVALAKGRDFAKASPVFAASLDMLASYPEPLFSRFAQLAGESFLATNDSDNAKRIVGLLRQRGGDAAIEQPAIVYMRGVIESRVGSLDSAKKLWTQVADTNDMLTRTRAGMALVDLGVASKTMAPVDAAKQLERLRYGWRGDSLELDLLQRLATAYASAGQLDEALGALEKAKRIAPNKANNDLIEAQQRQIFTDLFMSSAIDDYPPLKTLATYNRYRQFAPLDSAQALTVNNRLVDKMLKIDLLGQAADLLDQQVPITTDPAAKAKLGARIAGIRLLNLEPDKALKTLDASEAQVLPLDSIEERRLLRARALADSGQAQPALKVLDGDGSDDAKRLTATITWRAKDWPGAATALTALISTPGGEKLPPEQAQLIVRRAVALTLAGDTAGLAKLNADYGVAIKDTPSAASFALLTAPEGAIKALAALPSEMKDVDLFKDFLEAYRK